MYNTRHRWTLIVPAAGKGLRFASGEVAKQFVDVEGRSILGRAVDVALGIPEFHQIVIAASQDGIQDVRKAIGEERFDLVGDRLKIVIGGATRQESVAAALNAVSESSDLVFVHDAVRPLASESLYRRVAAGAQTSGAAVPALGLVDTIKEVLGDVVIATPDRNRYRRVQTPQAFRPDLLREGHRRAKVDGVEASDDAMLIENLGVSVTCVDGEETNLKVTTPSDLLFLRWYLAGNF